MKPIFPELPTKLGIYNLTQMLGEREHSELYLATQSYVDRAVAIEVLRPDSPAEMMEYFREAARLRAAVSLPHVSPVLESARTGNLNYLIQEQPPGALLMEHTEEKLSVAKAFSLIQAIAELYCACEEQGVAAQPLMLHDIYVDGDSFCFFSPVVAWEMSDDLRAAQMEQLASILEYMMDENEVATSNISIIIHWLRHGYGNAPLQWRPLAASLSTLRAQKTRGRSLPLGQRLRAMFGSRRALRMLMRNIGWRMGFALFLALITGGVAMLGFLFEEEVEEDRPALADGYLHCKTPDGVVRVQARPVSVQEYADFLSNWEQMSSYEREQICEGMADEVLRDHQPLQWADQKAAAEAGSEWLGVKMDMQSPVRGVSYKDALIYARYAMAELPTPAHVGTVRALAGMSLLEEWTSARKEARLPYVSYHIIYPSYGNDLQQEISPDKRDIKRGFRIIYKGD